VLRDLLADGVSIRNLRRVVELLIRYQTTEADARWPDPTAYIRMGLADAIANSTAYGATTTVIAYLLDPRLEDVLRTAFNPSVGTPIGAGAEVFLQVMRVRVAALNPLAVPLAILTQEDLARPLRALLREEFPTVKVLTFSELPARYDVHLFERLFAVEGRRAA
jgi:type III secretory pathway component EscV